MDLLKRSLCMLLCCGLLLGNLPAVSFTAEATEGNSLLSPLSELTVKEQLHSLIGIKNEMTTDEIRAAVQALGFDELLAAMSNDTEVVSYLATLGGYSDVTIENNVSIPNKMFNLAVGLTLNNVQNDAPVRLDKAVTPVPVPAGYDSDAAIHFSVNMDALGEDRTLDVPVCLMIMASDWIHPNFQHIFWRDPATNVVEEIPAAAYWGKTGWSVHFTVSAEGDYVMVAPESAVMSGSCGDNLTWSYDDTYTLTISGSGEMYDYDLEENKAPWHTVRENVSHIKIGEGVTSIGANAFYDCRFANKTEIPASVQEIGPYAFYGMDEQLFSFLGDAPVIADTAFYHAHYSTVYYHADKQGWENIASRSFVEVEDLKWISMEELSHSCGENLTWAFDETTGTLTISGTGEMDDYFEDLSLIPWKHLYDSITKVVIEDGVTSIGTYAFYECTKLEEISIPDSVKRIPISIYTGNMEKLVIPAGVTRLYLAFEENFVKFIEVVPENTMYSSDAFGVLFNKDKTVLECYPGGSAATSYTVPEGVISIGTAAFRGCRNIQSVTLPSSLKKLDNLAFCYSGLTKIRFLGDAPEFRNNVFSYLTADVYYPEGNPTWTETVRQNYGGTIRWIPYSKDCGNDHIYTDDADTTCDICGYERQLQANSISVYRFYNPYTNEHLLVSDEAEKNGLVKAGWTLEGVAWNAPKEGSPVYRLYNPDDWHTYTSSEEEMRTMVAAGWSLDGPVSCTGTQENGKPVYRLFNPYEKTNFHLFTAGVEERDMLVNAGWILEGVAWHAVK